ncbi:MAG TPA: hypothetical protein VKE24_14795 [Candidatus Acidoferrales bacterium]|nr:hypothetical protein [Candidatus Acidoferrales bacterium]
MQLGRRTYVLLGSLLVVALVVSGAAVANRADPVTLPQGTTIHVRLDHALASNQARPGDRFAATVSEPVIVEGKTALPQGTPVKGRVVEAKQSGRLKGVAHLRLALTEMEVGDKSYELRTTSISRVGGNHKKRNLAWIGGGGAGGAAIGAIAAGGEGALIGGPVGAGAGIAVAFLTGKKDIRLPPETPLTFKLTQPVTVGAKS